MADEAYVGGEAKLYYNAGTYASPTWTLIDNCDDVDIPDSRTAVPAPIRAMWPFIGYLTGSRDIGLTWGMVQKKGTTDAKLTAMIAAYEAGTPTEFAVTDGLMATVGTKRRRLTCVVVNKSEGQPLNGVVTVKFEAKPALNNAGNNPASDTIPAP